MSAVVYRMYDANCRLLYVGQSLNLTQRLGGHASTQPWWTDVDTITVEHFETRADAQAAEIEAIRGETPLYNIKHARKPRTPRPPVDTSTWPTTGLRMNPAFFDTIAQRTDGVAADHMFSVTPERLLAIRLGDPVDLSEASAICEEIGCQVAAMFPNRNPAWRIDDDDTRYRAFCRRWVESEGPAWFAAVPS